MSSKESVFLESRRTAILPVGNVFARKNCLHWVLGSFGFHWCGFHLCVFSKNAKRLCGFHSISEVIPLLMALGYQWSKSLEFGSCIFLQDLNNLHKPRTGCNSEYSKNGCQKSISSLGTSAPTARGFYLNSVKKCKHSSTYVL